MRRRSSAILSPALLLALATICGCQSGVQSMHRMIEDQAIQRTLDYPEPTTPEMRQSQPQRHDEHDEKPTSKCGCSHCSS